MEYRRKKRVLASYRKMNKRKLWLASGMTMMAISTGMYATQNVKADQVSVEAQNTQQVATDKDSSNISNTQNDQTAVQLEQNVSERKDVQKDSSDTSDQAQVGLNDTAQADTVNDTDQVQDKVENSADNSVADPNTTQELQLKTDEKQVNENVAENAQEQRLQVNKVTTKMQTPDAIYIGDSQYTRGDAIDVASYQSWLNQDDFNKLNQLGIKAVVVKLTEGQSYVNPAATKQINYAKNAGLTVSVYHYARFNDATTGYAEGQHVVNTMENLGLGQDTLIFADMEDKSTYSNDVSGNLNSFWNALSTAGFNNHAVYTGGGYPYHEDAIATVGRAKTWWSQYPFVPINNGYYENEWRNLGYGAWQFSSTAYLPGRENMGALDLSIDFNGLFSKSDTAEKPVTQQVFKDGHWYLIDQKTGQYLTGIQPITDQNKVVYYNAVGQMQYGQQEIDGHWYLFDQVTGAMQYGFQSLTPYGQDKTVYYANNGQMQYGQQKIDGYWYNFDTTDGAMKTGLVQIPEQNKTVYYANNGRMQYGWQWVNNATRYFDTFNGAMVTGQQKINGHWYLFDNNGAMQRGFQNLKAYGDDKTVYYNQDGWMLYGWQGIDNVPYYFDTFNGAMMTGERYLNGHWYLFNDKGQMQRGFQKVMENGKEKTVYYNYDGWRLYGWQGIDNVPYYFDKSTGAMMTGERYINGHWYLFNDKGQMQRGFQKVMENGKEKTVYYNYDGWMLYGWQGIDDVPYYFDTFNGAMMTGERYINGHWYLFNDKGQMQRGFQKVMENGKEKTVYYNYDGWMLYGWQMIDGKRYYFDTFNGALLKEE
ncbi:GH25 family lysozyme [uncultured Ligilactobacillus sp.]|uniref:GH25 family lysozyme n=1 Tax=uncultured Ligilactobacillus sp. TaxID=2837633 RepID=UPI002729C414|nr:GH25 family lysozyme [uncultured Ligilactobacillus sp.]